MLDASHIVRLHDSANAHGHDAAIPAPDEQLAFDALVLAQHRANFDLWHREDAARDPRATATGIVQAKQDIDILNQRRNDLAEEIDSTLLDSLPAQNEAAPLHSETPGLIIDRLSILSLKLFHTHAEIHRATASPEHRERNRRRLTLLQTQREDLASCLDQLWRDVRAGRRRFKLYRQLKMYNDPDLNPVLYAQGPKAQ